MEWPWTRWATNRRLLLHVLEGQLPAIDAITIVRGQLEGMMAKAADAKKAIAAEFEAVRADLGKMAAGIKAMTDAIAALRQQIANGGEVDDKDWDAIIDGGKAVQDAADAMAAAFPVEPPVEGSIDGGTNPPTDATTVPGGKAIDGQ